MTAAAIYYLISLRSNNKTRRAQLFMQIYDRMQEPEFQKNWSDLMDRDWTVIRDRWEKGEGKSPMSDVQFASVSKYFEGIAVMLKKGLIDADIVYELMPSLVYSFWFHYEPLWKLMRAKANYPHDYPQAGRMLEYLSGEMVRMAKQRGDPVIVKYQMDKMV